MNRLVLGLSFFTCISLYAEVSVFGAGDLNSPEPYGLTDTEKLIVKNKQIVQNNEKRLKKTNSLIQELQERIEGISSLLDAESVKLNKTYINLNKHKKEFEAYKTTLKAELSKKDETILKLDGALKTLATDVEANKKNIVTIKKSFDDIVKLVNEINSKYVTKKEFKQLISILDKRLTKAKKKPKKSNKQLMKEARRLFSKNYLTKAQPLFEELVSKKYRPAESSFYLGEIHFYKKRYKDSLYYFKKSMTLYDKAKYLPKLLLHSAIAFEKLDDMDNAQNFYTTIVELYPNSAEAKEASKKIKKQ